MFISIGDSGEPCSKSRSGDASLMKKQITGNILSRMQQTFKSQLVVLHKLTRILAPLPLPFLLCWDPKENISNWRNIQKIGHNESHFLIEEASWPSCPSRGLRDYYKSKTFSRYVSCVLFYFLSIWVFNLAFNLHFPNDFNDLLRCLFASCISSLVKCLFKSLACFYSSYLLSYYWILRSTYIRNRRRNQIFFWNYSPSIHGLSFHSPKDALDIAEVWSSYKVSFINLFLCGLHFSHQTQKTLAWPETTNSFSYVLN